MHTRPLGIMNDLVCLGLQVWAVVGENEDVIGIRQTGNVQRLSRGKRSAGIEAGRHVIDFEPPKNSSKGLEEDDEEERGEGVPFSCASPDWNREGGTGCACDFCGSAAIHSANDLHSVRWESKLLKNQIGGCDQWC